MSARVCATFALAGVVGVAVPALGQPEDFITGIPVCVQDASGGTYQPRAAGVPFDMWTNANTSGLFAFLAQTTGKHVLEDLSFAPGPWGSQAVRVIDGIDFSVWGNTGGEFRLRITLYDPADVNYAGFSGDGTSMINPAAVPLRVMEFPPTGSYSYTGEGFVIINNPIPGGPLALPASLPGVFAEMLIIDASGNPVPSTGDGAVFFSNNSGRGAANNLPENSINPAAPGFSSPSYGRDLDNDGVFIGQPASGTSGERRHIITLTGTSYYTYGYSIALRGDIVATPPVCTPFTLGASNAFASASSTLADNGVQWYCITLPVDATDANSRYIDLDTYGSGTDVAIGLFTSAGIRVAVDDESGGGGQALLSSGMGRRDNPDGGVDYQGWNYLATGVGIAPPGFDGLPAGTYYVAVAAAGGGAIFGDGFFASGSGPGGGATLRVRTNVADGVLTPSDPPTATRILGVSAEDPIVAPGGITANVALYSPNVQWYDVQLCRDADAGNAVSFTGTSAAGSEPLGRSIYIFNDSGNLVGSATEARPGTPVVNFGGTDPALPAGRYYICLAFNYGGSDVDLAPNPSTNGRWHVRPTVNDGGYTLGAQVLVPWSDCSNCGTADFDGDGDTGTDADIEAFFACLAGNCCGTCWVLGADFNGDGDVGTDADIESFFRVLAGGPC